MGGFLALTSVCPWSPAPPHPYSWLVVREELGFRPSPRVSADPAPGRGVLQAATGAKIARDWPADKRGAEPWD